MNYSVYLISNKMNNKKYVGITNNIKRRFSEHKSKRLDNNYKKMSVIRKAITKYGEENFYFEIIEDNLSNKEAYEREMYWIDKLGTCTPNGYNITKGGEGTRGLKISRASLTDDQKIKISNSLKGRTDHIDVAREGYFKYMSNLSEDEIKERNDSTSRNNPFNKQIIGINIKTKENISFYNVNSAVKWIKENTEYKKSFHTRILDVLDKNYSAYGYKWLSNGRPTKEASHTKEYYESLTDEEKEEYKRKRFENNPRKKSVTAINQSTGESIQFDSFRKASKWISENTKHNNATHSRIGKVCNTGNVAYGYKWEIK